MYSDSAYRHRRQDQSSTQEKPTSGISTSASSSYLAALLASAGAERLPFQDDVTADSILEDHVSRVWEEVSDSSERTQCGSVLEPSRTSKNCFVSEETPFNSMLQMLHRTRTTETERRATYHYAGNRMTIANCRSAAVLPPKTGIKQDGSKELVERFTNCNRKDPKSSSFTFFLQDDTRHSEGNRGPKGLGWPQQQPTSRSVNSTGTDRPHADWMSRSNSNQYNDWRHPLQTRRTNLPQAIHYDRQRSSQLISSHPLESSTSRCGASWEEAAVGLCSNEQCPPSTDVTIVGYYLCEDPIPYRTTLPGKTPTLGQFKQLLTRKGNLRFFFRKASDEFDSGVVHEEITDDSAVLPLWEGKIFGKIELIQ